MPRIAPIPMDELSAQREILSSAVQWLITKVIAAIDDNELPALMAES